MTRRTKALYIAAGVVVVGVIVFLVLGGYQTSTATKDANSALKTMAEVVNRHDKQLVNHETRLVDHGVRLARAEAEEVTSNKRLTALEKGIANLSRGLADVEEDANKALNLAKKADRKSGQAKETAERADAKATAAFQEFLRGYRYDPTGHVVIYNEYNSR